MYDDELSFQKDDNTKSLVTRFNQMIENDKLEYFESEEIEKIIDYFCECKDKTKIKEAFLLFEKLYPFSSQIVLKKTQVLLFFDKAKQALKQINNLPPSLDDDYLFTLSAVHSSLGHHQKAANILNKMLEVNPNNEEIISNLAGEYQHLGNYFMSNNLIEKLLRMKYKNQVYWFAYILSTELENNISRSINFIQDFIKTNPYDYDAWFYLGIAHQRNDDHLNALEAYDYAICIKEDYIHAYVNKAESLAKLGYYQNAIDCCIDTFKFREPTAELYFDIGDYYEKLDKLDKAKLYFYKSIKKDENHDSSWFALALILDLQGQHLEASYHIKKAIDIDPNCVDYLFSYAQISEKVGFIKEAEIAYQKVLDLDEFDSECWLNYSHLISEYECIYEAIALLKKAIKLNPKNADLAFRIAAYHFKSGNDDLALRFFKEALLIDYEKHQRFFDYLPSVKSNKFLLNLLIEHKK
ncbi:MAG: tetratricopeptide repeat protein [Bacteroidota bacterium]|nr:tetratricopeptide repeat protein [Bacteroidota bacterium]